MGGVSPTITLQGIKELTYPTLGKGKSSSKVPFLGDMLVPWRVVVSFHLKGSVFHLNHDYFWRGLGRKHPSFGFEKLEFRFQR